MILILQHNRISFCMIVAWYALSSMLLDQAATGLACCHCYLFPTYMVSSCRSWSLRKLMGIYIGSLILGDIL